MVFCLAATIAVAATAWMSITLIKSDAEQRQSEADLRQAENLRAALWRLDVFLGPLLATETSRDHAAMPQGRLPTSSPSPFRKLDFVRFNSTDLKLRPGGVGRPEDVETLGNMLSEGQLDTPAKGPNLGPGALYTNSSLASNFLHNDFGSRKGGAQRAQTLQHEGLQQSFLNVSWQPLAPAWLRFPIGGPAELLLVRQQTQTQTHAQGGLALRGVWLNRARLEDWFRKEIKDLFPTCRFEILDQDWLERGGRDYLSSIPLRLVVETTHLEPISSTTRFGMAAAWLAVLLGLAGLALLLRQTLALSERKARFAAAVTHELRTPLTTFRLYTQMLVDGMVQEESKPAYINTLYDEAERLHRVVENLLVYSQVEDGRPRLQGEDLDFEEFATSLRSRLENFAREQDLEFKWHQPDTLPPTLRTDRSAVEQIATNLIENAAKYGRSEVASTLDVNLAVQNDTWSLTFADRGPGVSAAVRRRIFEPFTRGSRDEVAFKPGLGLGLTISRGLARELGGDLKLIDDPHFGATFQLRLPR
ncbi:MAG: HAMP domain-containing sensor histidine kinase [Planctomycetota bacterium]